MRPVLTWVLAPVFLAALAAPVVLRYAPPRAVEITVTEGTSMSVAVSLDGRTLAIDLQGSIWTLPAGGGRARQVGDAFNDARQPSWSPDGGQIAFQGYRDGTYDIWAVAPDGSGLKQLTSGSYDDREPAWSHDGTRVAFASDRSPGGNYDIWIVDVRTGQLRRLTTDGANEYMPTWSPDDSQIAFVSNRTDGAGLWAVSVASGAERKLPDAPAQANAPSWGPGDRIVYHVTSRLEVDGQSLTGSENAFPFRVSWSSPTEFFYTADGKIRKRALGGAAAQTIDFSATLSITPASYTRRTRDFDSRTPRRVLGIVAPRISPDGSTVSFAALGDVWTMRIGETPRNLTNDRHLDTEPAWSPDGTRIAYASDKGGGLLNIWVREVTSGAARQVTRVETSAMAPVWSPDGTRIAFLDVDGIWRRASVKVVDVASGRVTQITESLFGPGTPTWSPDGTRVAVAALAPYSTRFREGTIQILMVPAAGGESRWITAPDPHFTIDSRVGAGPVWSPDGSKMALVSGGRLVVANVSRAGDWLSSQPLPDRAGELPHSPSWTGDSKSIVYQSMDGLRMVDWASGAVRNLPLELTYTPAIPTTRVLVHAGRLVDGLSPTARTDMDVVVEGNRIRSVEPHRAELHNGVQVVDASGQSVMPGLIEFHTHLSKDYAEAHGRAWLSFGITTVRSPGGTPYEAVEDREANEAGVRPGPRVYSTGYLMEWQRSYYKFAVAVQDERHLELELERAKRLDFDFLKSYVRMPDLQQRRIVEFAHGMGVPAASHEIYPAALVGIDGVEHTTGTSRRGYSPKVAPAGRSYSDVARIIGAANMSFTPTLGLANTWLTQMVVHDPAMKSDARLGLLPPWMRTSITDVQIPPAGSAPTPTPSTGGAGEMIMAISRAGGRVVAGTDTPNPLSLHGELAAYVASGMTPFEALRSATVTPAQALRLDAGSVEVGKLADLVVVDGNPLVNIWDAHKVRVVIANGRVFPMRDLVTP